MNWENVCSSACLYNFFEILCAIQWYWHLNWMIATMVKEIMWSGKEKLICLIMVVQREELWFDVYIVMLWYKCCYTLRRLCFFYKAWIVVRVPIPRFLIGWLNASYKIGC